jgi:hypothetical protein
VFIDPNNADYGTVFRPSREPLQYFLDTTERPSTPLSPPRDGDLAPLPPGLQVPSLPPSPVQSLPPSDDGWGTHIPPSVAADSGGELGNLGKAIESYLPPDPKDPDNTA